VASVDWAPLFALAGLDLSQFKPAEPLWNWLAGADTRAAWTGTWPQSGRPLRVEAAALGGHPVAFMLIGPWRKPWRVPDPSGDQSNWAVMIVLALAISILAGAGLLARKNLRDGRGDRHGATRVAVAMISVLLVLWAMQVHLVASLGLPVMFLLAICTSVFYGALLWTIYVALEPSVRRHWPHVLVSWTSVLTGHARDAVVGRDVLIGTAVGVAWAVMIRGADGLTGGGINFPGTAELLSGLRSAIGVVLQQAPYAMRNAFVYLSMLFVARLLVRREWVAALMFAGVFTLLDLIGNDEGWSGPLLTLVYFGSGAFVLLRLGLLAFAVAVFVAPLCWCFQQPPMRPPGFSATCCSSWRRSSVWRSGACIPRCRGRSGRAPGPSVEEPTIDEEIGSAHPLPDRVGGSSDVRAACGAAARDRPRECAGDRRYRFRADRTRAHRDQG
jgi:hypothetical protein